MNVLIDYSQGKFDIKKYGLMSDEELEEEIKNIIKENLGTPENAIMGRVMAKLRGKAEGNKIADMVKKLAKSPI
jgi:glutamyl-tRNA(Gln) amidotransferase subunit E